MIGTFIFEITVQTITIQTVVMIGPIEFSANTESSNASAAITVKATAAYPNAAKYRHITSSLVICNISDIPALERNTSISSTPKISILKNKAVTAIHTSNNTV